METILHMYKRLILKISRDTHSSCHFLLNTLRGTEIILPAVILYDSTLSSQQILTPKRYDEHPCHFYRGVPPPPGIFLQPCRGRNASICTKFTCLLSSSFVLPPLSLPVYVCHNIVMGLATWILLRIVAGSNLFDFLTDTPYITQTQLLENHVLYCSTPRSSGGGLLYDKGRRMLVVLLRGKKSRILVSLRVFRTECQYFIPLSGYLLQ